MSNNSNSGSNRALVPGAREGLDKFKMEAASEVGVNLKEGYAFRLEYNSIIMKKSEGFVFD